MSDIPLPIVFHTGCKEDGHAAVFGEASGRVRARKRMHPVQVRFADRLCAVETLEGVVQARVGDAIVTGMFGEPWPVARGGFADKYQALPPLEMGAPGTYVSLSIDVVAVRMCAPFDVVLADGHSRLSGQVGDWLVDYGDGTLGIVNAAIFDATYEILGAA